MWLTRVFVVFCAIITIVHCSNILVILPTFGPSHFYAFDALVTGLSNRGHNITFMSPLVPKSVKSKNVKHIPLTGDHVDGITFDILSSHGAGDTDSHAPGFLSAFAFHNMAMKTCGSVLPTESVLNTINNTDNKFDIVIVEAFVTDCFAPIAKEFNASLVLFSTSMLMPWYYDSIGQPDNPAYIPSLMSGVPSKMKFKERVVNVMVHLWQQFFRYVFIARFNDVEVKDIYGKPIDSGKLIQDTSLMLTNTYFPLNGAFPNVPAKVDIGGIHIGKLKAVPEECL